MNTHKQSWGVGEDRAHPTQKSGRLELGSQIEVILHAEPESWTESWTESNEREDKIEGIGTCSPTGQHGWWAHSRQ